MENTHVETEHIYIYIYISAIGPTLGVLEVNDPGRTPHVLGPWRAKFTDGRPQAGGKL